MKVRCIGGSLDGQMVNAQGTALVGRGELHEDGTVTWEYYKYERELNGEIVARFQIASQGTRATTNNRKGNPSGC